MTPWCHLQPRCPWHRNSRRRTRRDRWEGGSASGSGWAWEEQEQGWGWDSAPEGGWGWASASPSASCPTPSLHRRRGGGGGSRCRTSPCLSFWPPKRWWTCSTSSTACPLWHCRTRNWSSRRGGEPERGSSSWGSSSSIASSISLVSRAVLRRSGGRAGSVVFCCVCLGGVSELPVVGLYRQRTPALAPHWKLTKHDPTTSNAS